MADETDDPTANPDPPTAESGDAGKAGDAGGAAAAGDAQAPSEEELRAQLEEEIRKVRIEDVVLQSAVSILNLAARRIAKDDERDLEQGRIGIEAARALADLVPGEAQAQLKQAVSELQMLYAQHAGEGAGGGGGGDAAPKAGAGEQAQAQPDTPKKPGDSGLWTPHGADE